ncbi:MAG: OsmC family peroxiredoxin [Dehalococcoidia bacterium]
MATSQSARVRWLGDLVSGTGRATAVSSQQFDDLPVGWPARTEGPTGRTTPEELLAAAHATCFAMALSAKLGRVGTPPTSLDVTVTVTFDRIEDAWMVTHSHLDVCGTVAGMSAEAFQQAAREAKETCLISRALRGNVELTVNAALAD